MSDPTPLQVRVNEALLAAAERELIIGMMQQNAKYTARIERFFPQRAKQFVRIFALGLCAFGLVLCLVLIALTPVGSESFVFGAAVLMLLCFLGFVFYRLDALESWVRGKSIAFASRRLMQRTRLNLAPIRKEMPDAFVYQVEDGAVASEWRKDGTALRKNRFVLSRLTFALVGKHCVALYPTERSVAPRLILFSVEGEIIDALRRAAITVKEVSPEPPDRYSLPPPTL